MPILNWLNKDEAVTTAKKCTYRLLEEVPELSYGDADNENLLIQGDNLEALKALIPHYAGKIKCIYIDPPYNTKSAFEHYDDNLEHSRWLSMIYPRLELLRELLSEDGSIWVSIDDNESHYLKVIMDEVFGRNNFVANNIWQKLYTVKNSAKYLSDMHEHVICYAKSLPKWERNLLPRSDKAKSGYSNPDNDHRGPWTTNAIQARNFYSLGSYTIVGPTGREFIPPAGTFWRISEDSFKKLDEDKRIWWGQKGESTPRVKKFLSEAKEGVVPATFWSYQDVGSNAEAKAENRALFEGVAEIFTTPKPEKLIQRILTIASNEGDLILDSFLGSGTTAASAHKMKRRYIGIELGTQAQSHCQPRLKKVVDGTDVNGISEAVNWQRGGGFRFYQLGEAVFDEYGCLNGDIKFSTLAAHIWYLETKMPIGNKADTPLLGVHNDTAYYLLYNGILGDRRPTGGNVLTSKVLNSLPDIDKHERIVIYGESSRLGETRLKEANITFKQIPYDVGTL
ncbi:site-specific DNA-methyltransferase [Aliivibrio fischeri]|uniref:site-specific DNA-methyltransferase n=1 Tax=Aliivibrio fischeri TaxID=668 RepID=UPI0012D9997A|nr:site-specific DNA-methyltransferase [Aliivibrio fischeri]MUK75530.1 site-specific DNA-methyltransferase [Aliivibrio fischeri]